MSRFILSAKICIKACPIEGSTRGMRNGEAAAANDPAVDLLVRSGDPIALTPRLEKNPSFSFAVRPAGRHHEFQRCLRRLVRGHEHYCWGHHHESGR